MKGWIGIGRSEASVLSLANFLVYDRTLRHDSQVLEMNVLHRALFKAVEHGFVQRPQQAQNSTIEEAVTNFPQMLEAKVANNKPCPVGGTK